MSKHGTVTVDAAGVPTFTEASGVINYVKDAATTVFSTTKAPVGYAAVVQRIGLVAIGNMVAVHSLTGGLGVSALGRTVSKGR